jgi:hypothetical protein
MSSDKITISRADLERAVRAGVARYIHAQQAPLYDLPADIVRGVSIAAKGKEEAEASDDVAAAAAGGGGEEDASEREAMSLFELSSESSSSSSSSSSDDEDEGGCSVDPLVDDDDDEESPHSKDDGFVVSDDAKVDRYDSDDDADDAPAVPRSLRVNGRRRRRERKPVVRLAQTTDKRAALAEERAADRTSIALGAGRVSKNQLQQMVDALRIYDAYCYEAFMAHPWTMSVFGAAFDGIAKNWGTAQNAQRIVDLMREYLARCMASGAAPALIVELLHRNKQAKCSLCRGTHSCGYRVVDGLAHNARTGDNYAGSHCIALLQSVLEMGVCLAKLVKQLPHPRASADAVAAWGQPAWAAVDKCQTRILEANARKGGTRAKERALPELDDEDVGIVPEATNKRRRTRRGQ